MFCYSNHGDSMVAVRDDYQPKVGEILFNNYASEEELINAFPDRLVIKESSTKAENLKRINIDVGNYIFSYYDIGTQISFISLYILPETSEEVKKLIESAWEWGQSILKYYYSVKQSIIDGESFEWDLNQFDKTKPQVSLKDIIP